jgi:AcrR family transcriptional regulator
MSPRPTPDQRKTAILDAVVRVIIDVGFTQMTVADVARVASVSTALVHYHFSSKIALIVAALRAASDDDKQLRDRIANGPGSALARLDRVLCGSLPATPQDGSWLLWVETWGETRREPEIWNVMADLNEHEHSRIVALIAEGIADGVFTTADADAVADRLMALRDGLAIQHTLFASDQPAEQFRELIRAAIRNNLGVSVDRYASLLEATAPKP